MEVSVNTSRLSAGGEAWDKGATGKVTPDNKEYIDRVDDKEGEIAHMEGRGIHLFI